jgi:hypothetical protein
VYFCVSILIFTGTGMIVYTDNKNIVLYYECSRILEDGTCDPEHTQLHFSTRTRNTPKHVFRSLKVMLENHCFDLSDIQFVSHEGKFSVTS